MEGASTEKPDLVQNAGSSGLFVGPDYLWDSGNFSNFLMHRMHWHVPSMVRLRVSTGACSVFHPFKHLNSEYTRDAFLTYRLRYDCFSVDESGTEYCCRAACK